MPKYVKSIISLILSLQLCICTGAMVLAEDYNGSVSVSVAPTPVFTMDLSEYTSDSQVVKNGVTESADGIKVVNASDAVKPNVKTYYDSNGDEVLALQTGTYEGTATTALGAVRVSHGQMNTLLGDKHEAEITYTFWAKNYGVSDSGSVLNFQYSNSTTLANCGLSSYNQKTDMEFSFAGGTAKHTQRNLSANTWHFYAVSKKWTENPENPGYGTWDYIYNYGETTNSGTTSEIKYTNNTAMTLQIGARMKHSSPHELSYVFNGEIAGVQVFNSALTQDQLTAIRTSQGYDKLLAPAELTFGKDENNKPTDTNFTFQSSGTAGDKTDFEVMNENGVEFVRITHSGTGDTFLGYDFGTAQDESFVIDAKIRISQNYIYRALRINGDDALTVHDMGLGSSFGVENKDDTGFVNMRYEFDYLGDAAWRVTKYDRVKDTVFNKGAVTTHEIADGLKTIDFKVWAGGTNIYPHGTDYYLDIAELRIYRKSGRNLFADIIKLDGDTETPVYSVNAEGDYKVTLTAAGVAEPNDTYAYFAIYEQDSFGNSRLKELVGGMLDDTMSVTDTFTLETEGGSSYTAKALLWGDGLVPLVKSINYKYETQAETESFYFASRAIASGCTNISSNGATLKENDGVLIFANVDFGTYGKNNLDIYIDSTGEEELALCTIYIGKDMATAERYETFLLAGANEGTESDLVSIPIKKAAGAQNVYITSRKGALSSKIIGISANNNSSAVASHDGAEVAASDYNSVNRIAADADDTVSVVDGAERYVTGTYPGTCLAYYNVKVAEDASRLAVKLASANVNHVLTFHLGSPDADAFATYRIDASSIAATGYCELSDKLPAGIYDIYVKFNLAGTSDFYSFGFLP